MTIAEITRIINKHLTPDMDVGLWAIEIQECAVEIKEKMEEPN